MAPKITFLAVKVSGELCSSKARARGAAAQGPAGGAPLTFLVISNQIIKTPNYLFNRPSIIILYICIYLR